MKTESWLERLLYLWPVKILSVAGAVLLYFFTTYLSLETRTVTVPIHYELPSGYTQAEAFPTSALVKIRGIKKDIFDIQEADLVVGADLSRHEAAGGYKAKLRIGKLGMVAKINPLELDVEPAEVTINLERLTVKQVPVELKSTGSPNLGYELSTLSCPVAQIEIGGPERVLAAIQSVAGSAVDLTGHDADFYQQVRVLSPDPLVRIMSNELVEVHAQIRESAGSLELTDVPVELVGLDHGLAMNQKLGDGSIKLYAPDKLIGQIDRSQIRLIIDASAIHQPGSYSVKLIPAVPSSAVVLHFSPDSLELRFTQAVDKAQP